MSGQRIQRGDLVMVVNRCNIPCVGAWAGTTYTAGEQITDRGHSGWCNATGARWRSVHCARCFGYVFDAFEERHLLKLAGPAPTEQQPAAEPAEASA